MLVQEKGREGVLRPTPQQPTPKPVATGMSQTTTSEQLQDFVPISVGGGVEVDSETQIKSNHILFVTYTWLADVNASVAKCLCF